MNIIACVKAILDPELPPAKFRIDTNANKVIPPQSMPPVISPYDANAVEAGLQLKDSQGGKLTAITVGRENISEAVRHALAMGADEAVIVADERLESMDSFSIAYVLAQTIKKIGEFDLVLCGRQAADTDNGLMGGLLAGKLDLPLVTVARSIELADNILKVEQVLSDGYQVFEVPLPALITVGEEIGQPRLPSGWGVISAARKQIPAWTLDDVNVDLSLIQEWAGRLKLQRLYIPDTERKREIVEGEDAAEAAANLVKKLRQAGVV